VVGQNIMAWLNGSDDHTDRTRQSVFYRELQINYHSCYNHRWIYSVGVYHRYYRRTISIDGLQRVLKYLPPMPQSPTTIPSVITVENTDECRTCAALRRSSSLTQCACVSEKYGETRNSCLLLVEK
jgi:hypothetical protein